VSQQPRPARLSRHCAEASWLDTPVSRCSRESKGPPIVFYQQIPFTPEPNRKVVTAGSRTPTNESAQRASRGAFRARPRDAMARRVTIRNLPHIDTAFSRCVASRASVLDAELGRHALNRAMARELSARIGDPWTALHSSWKGLDPSLSFTRVHRREFIILCRPRGILCRPRGPESTHRDALAVPFGPRSSLGRSNFVS
jgi:hypothetical protein